jgi:hypothetical protein
MILPRNRYLFFENSIRNKYRGGEEKGRRIFAVVNVRANVWAGLSDRPAFFALGLRDETIILACQKDLPIQSMIHRMGENTTR